MFNCKHTTWVWCVFRGGEEHQCIYSNKAKKSVSSRCSYFIVTFKTIVI